MPFLLLRTLRYSAAGLLFLSLLLPWMSVPFGVHGNLQVGYAAIVAEPATTLFFKALLLLIIMGGWWFGRSAPALACLRLGNMDCFLELPLLSCHHDCLSGSDDPTLREVLRACGLDPNAKCSA